MAIYYISDLHLNHPNVLNFDKRPFNDIFEMNETIINNWNSRITNDDIGYILGDMIWSKEKEWKEILVKMNGRKVLIRGNHDPKEFASTTKRHFEDIKDKKDIVDNGRRVIMGHYPEPFFVQDYRENAYMLYGHVHNTEEWNDLVDLKLHLLEKYSKPEFAEWSGKNRCQFINVGCMMPWMNYYPRTLDEIIEGESKWFEEEKKRRMILLP